MCARLGKEDALHSFNTFVEAGPYDCKHPRTKQHERSTFIRDNFPRYDFAANNTGRPELFGYV